MYWNAGHLQVLCLSYLPIKTFSISLVFFCFPVTCYKQKVFIIPTSIRIYISSVKPHLWNRHLAVCCQTHHKKTFSWSHGVCLHVLLPMMQPKKDLNSWVNYLVCVRIWRINLKLVLENIQRHSLTLQFELEILLAFIDEFSDKKTIKCT